MKKNKIKVIGLFSGCGGLDLGFKQAGYDLIWSNDILKDACDTYRLNIGDHILNEDITKIDLDTIPNTDIIIGGPPCQGFSLAGKRDSDDSRNKLYLEYFKMIELYNPECFVMENVKGILSMKNEKKQLVIDEIKDIAGKIGYKLSIFNLNACDFAVPQKRERVFIIGHKKKEYEKPQPIIKKEKYITIKDAIQFLEKYDENKELIIEDNELNNNYIKYLSNSINLQELYKSYA